MENVVEKLQALGGTHVMLATAASAEAISKATPGLHLKGKLMALAVPFEPIQGSAGDLVIGERQIVGSLTGNSGDAEDTLDYSALQDVRATITTFPLRDAYDNMMLGEVRFRNVLVTS